jgi:phosphate transport system protein
MSETHHTARSFDRELTALSDSISTMGEFALRQVQDSTLALVEQDRGLATRVIDQDKRLDEFQKEISAAASIVIARRQAFASDLDILLGNLKIAEDLERIGDLAKNNAKRTLAMMGLELPGEVLARMRELANLAADQLAQALATYENRDAPGALRVRKQDEAIDELHTMLFGETVTRMSSAPSLNVAFVHLLFCAKNIERIGDHATHIAEAAYVRATGDAITAERRRRDGSSFVARPLPDIAVNRDGPT